MGIHPLEGHLQLSKDIVRGMKLTDTTFTPLCKFDQQAVYL